MIDKLKKMGTTYTVGLFLVSAVSGVFLFFHIGSAAFKDMHVWLSMVLLLPVGFHLWKNWPAFTVYFKRKTIVLPLVLSFVVSLAFAAPSLMGSSAGGNPLGAAIAAIESGTVTQIATLYHVTPDELTTRLAAKGYTVTSPEQTLSAVKQASGKGSGRELLAALASAE